MIYFRNVNLSFLDKKLFDNINWTIHAKSRIGLVGNNGTGKTTLFRAMLGQISVDAGLIEIPDRKQKRIGYLPQDMVELEAINLIDFLKEKSGIAALEETIRGLEHEMARIKQNTGEFSELSKAYADAMSEYNSRDGYAFEARAKQVLRGFGFRESDFARNCDLFSGGWKMRIMLTSILLAEPQIMLLDEPTNHLDTESMEWLESYLKNYTGTIIVISHDRYFLDKIVTQIVELSSCRITLYKGNYSFYLQEKEGRALALKKELELQKSQVKKIEKFVERFRYKATKAAQVQSRLKMLEKFDVITLESKTKNVVMNFPECRKSAKEVVNVAGLIHRYGNLNVFSGVDFSLFRGDKVAFVGINGSGKSTLSRLLSLTEKPVDGSITYGEGVNMSFFSQEAAENLNFNNTIWEEVNTAPTRANDQVKRNLLGAFLFSGDDVFKKVAVLSGGEKSRLSLMKIMLTDTNFLILDEPTNHLDLQTKEIFQNALINYSGTVAIVSHDRFFLDNLVNKVLELKEGNLTEYKGNYSYFIEKRSQLSQPPVGQDHSAAPPPAPSLTSRDKKRLEAEERNRLSKIKNSLKKELSALEEQIRALEEKKTANEAALCDPLSHRNPARIRELNVELKEIEKQLNCLYDIWTEVSFKLEENSAVNTG